MSFSLFTKTTLLGKQATVNHLRAVFASSFHTNIFSSQAASVSAEWTADSVRTGVIAKKKGMTSVWSENGIRMPVTVLQVNNLKELGSSISLNDF